MFDTNPETVRRWIRDKKLIATKTSNREGNIVTQAHLEAFAKSSPKYLPKLLTGIATLSPVSAFALVPIIGGIATGVAMYALKKKNEQSKSISLDDFKQYLQNEIQEEEKEVARKQDMIVKTQLEITDIMLRIEKYRNLLNDNMLLEQAYKMTQQSNEDAGSEMKGGED